MTNPLDRHMFNYGNTVRQQAEDADLLDAEKEVYAMGEASAKQERIDTRPTADEMAGLLALAQARQSAPRAPSPQKEAVEQDIYEKYGVTPDNYNQWNWLRDVGYGMMSNEGTGILDSFGLAATAANKNLREASASNRAMKNKLRIAEVKAIADAAKAEKKTLGKTRTVYNEETGREEVWVNVRMGTPGAIPDPYTPGRFIVIEPKKPTAAGGKGKSGSRAATALKPELMKTALERAAVLSGEAEVAMDDETRQALAVFMDIFKNSNAVGIDGEPLYTSYEVSKARDSYDRLLTSTRKEGRWFKELTKAQRGAIVQQTRDKTLEALKTEEYKDSDPVSLYNRLAEDAVRGVNWNLEGLAKVDSRFNEDDYRVMQERLGDIVGQDLAGDWFNFDWLDVMDSRLNEMPGYDRLGKPSSFEILQRDSLRTEYFLNDVAAKLREVADGKGVSVRELGESEVDEVMLAGLATVSGGGKGMDPFNPKATVRDMGDFIPEPRDITEKLQASGYNIKWERASDGRFGYRDLDSNKFLPYDKVVDYMNQR